MLTRIEAYNASGDTLALPLQGGTVYTVKNIEGLGPVKAELVSSNVPTLPGAFFQASSRGERNLLLTLGIVVAGSGPSVAEQRAALYPYFMPETVVSLRFFVDGVHFVNITGIVESMEPVIFTKDPEVVISIRCMDPDFLAPTETTVTGTTVSSSIEQEIAYSGSIATGFTFALSVDRSISSVSLYNRAPNGSLYTLDFVSPLVAGDVLTISTVPGKKHATLTRGGMDSSLLYGVSPTAQWFKLFPGSNFFRAVVSGDPIDFTLKYTARHGGL